jgi:acetylornithine deacetylase/succinyl-diaminopimelate desuccinylase-like protein
MKPITVYEQMLQRQIEELAAISESPAPVVTRVLFSEADLRARAYVKKICEEARLTLREDAVGNIFARWVGSAPELPAVATGSHIDAFPTPDASMAWWACSVPSRR